MVLPFTLMAKYQQQDTPAIYEERPVCNTLASKLNCPLQSRRFDAIITSTSPADLTNLQKQEWRGLF